MFKEAFEKSKNTWMAPERRKAFDLFQKLGLPSTKLEEWKYTSLRTLQDKNFTQPFRLDAGDLLKHQPVKTWLAGLQISPWQIVFADGYFVKELSRIPTDKKLFVQNLSVVGKRNPAVLKKLFKQAPLGDKAFSALNQALVSSGAFIWAKKSCELTDPLVIIHLSSQPGVVNTYRNFIQVDSGARLKVMEMFKGFDQEYISNVVTQVKLRTGAHLSYFKSQDEGSKGYHIHTLHADLNKDSELVSHLFSVGASLARNEIQVDLREQNARCELNGLFAGGEKQHVDNNTFINHMVESCQSEQLYKGILDGSAHGVFSGKVVVAPHAQKTDSKQASKNLLLSEDAQIDTKPQLMIYADDVKCSHGATIGQLDKEQLFYLQSRGINVNEARQILIKAFCEEMIEKISDLKIKEYCERAVTNWFHHQTLH